MIWHDAGRIALQIGTPLAAVRVLTWLVALFGSERLSKRAMWLLRRPPRHEHTARDREQADALSVFTLTDRDLDRGEDDDPDDAGPELARLQGWHQEWLAAGPPGE